MKPLDVTLVPRKQEQARTAKRRMKAMERGGAAISELTEYATVIAIDPGGTTGWSLMQAHPEALSPMHPNIYLGRNIEHWQHGQVDCGSTKGNLGNSLHRGISTDGENAGVNELIGLIRCWPGSAVVIEDFILDPARFNTGRDLLSPVRITSALGFDLWLQKSYYFVQGASLAKRTMTDERLKTMGYYSSTGGMQHARDADRHALTFLKRCANPDKRGRDLREQAWPHLFGPGAEFYEPGRRKT